MSARAPDSHPAQLRAALKLLVLLTLLTGVIYPLVVTGLARLMFPRQASGALLRRGDAAVGSQLIGQSFSDPGHFWGRPSATTPQPYNALGSGGSNLGPLNPAFTDAVRIRVAQLRSLDPGNSQAVPIDLVTASASGLDPQISVAAAAYQAERVARVRGIPIAAVRALIAAHTEGRLLGVIGEPRINVLELNLALDTLKVK
jgi:K+-transporting ATPase ATPase C chain